MNMSKCNCIIHQLTEQPFSSRDYNSQKEIIEIGRPTPHLNLTKQTKTCMRHFHQEWYRRDLWLCGCEKLDALFCWPCLLFSNEVSCWTQKGVSNLSNYPVMKKRHEQSVSHISSRITLQKLDKSRIKECLDWTLKINWEKRNEKIKENRFIVSCLVDSVCFMAEQGLSFCSHRETNESCNRDIIIELLKYRAHCDFRLRNNLKPTLAFIAKSPDVQNELIDAISTVVLNRIKDEIKQAPFVSVILEEARDCNYESQISLVLRYVASDGIQERFVSFIDVNESQNASCLAALLVEILSRFDCDSKVVAQSYDGCATISQVHSDLRKLIRDTYGSALFIHCYAHRLNLILKQSVEHISECKAFFKTLSGILTFFSGSTKRKTAFDENCRRRLRTVDLTRWIFANRLVETVSDVKEDLLLFFYSFANDSGEWDGETRACASGFCNALQDFDFNFMLSFFSMVLPKANQLVNILDLKMDATIYSSYTRIEEYKSSLVEKLEAFDIFWENCENQFPSQSLEDRITLNERKALYHSLYCEMLDTMIRHLGDRFSYIEQLEFLSILNENSYESYSQKFPVRYFNSLISSYEDFFNPPLLKAELSFIYASPEFRKSTLDLYRYLNETGLNSALPEVTKLCALFLTIPAASTSVVRSSSATKRIKAYLRRKQTQERISKLPLLSIEQPLLKSLKTEPTFYDAVIDIFAANNRRLDLTYNCRGQQQLTNTRAGVKTEDTTSWISESLSSEDSSHSELVHSADPLALEDESRPGTSSTVDIASLPGTSSMGLDPFLMPSSSSSAPPPSPSPTPTPPSPRLEMPPPRFVTSQAPSPALQSTNVTQSLPIPQQKTGGQKKTLEETVVSSDLQRNEFDDALLETNQLDAALQRLQCISEKVDELGGRDDNFDNFGKYVASLLRGLPTQRAVDLQQEVINLILRSHINPETPSVDSNSASAQSSSVPSTLTPETVRTLPQPQPPSLPPPPLAPLTQRLGQSKQASSTVPSVSVGKSVSVPPQRSKGEKRPLPDDASSSEAGNKQCKLDNPILETEQIDATLKKLEEISDKVNQLNEKDDNFDNFGKYAASLLRCLPTQRAVELQREVVNLILREHGGSTGSAPQKVRLLNV